MHVQIELFGGPEDGRELTLPIGTDGEPLSPLPVPSTHLHEMSSAGADPSPSHEVAWYEKYFRRDNAWIYKYTTAQTVRSS